MVRAGAWPPLPEPLPSPVVDNHAHLEFPAGDTEVSVAQRLDDANAVNVVGVVQIGCDLDSAHWTVQAVREHPGMVGGVALHPNDAARLHAEGRYQEAFAQIAQLARSERIRVVGETGLDYYRTGPRGHAAQQQAFRDHIALAKELGLVLQIHDRDAHQDVMDILKRDGAPERTVFHCFSGDVAMAQECARNEWYVSFAGTLTFANATHLREALVEVPAELVLVETDSPFLTPSPHRGAPNSPAQVAHTMRAVAAVTGTDLAAVCERIYATSVELYGPW